jgi:hypothetical protein
MGETGEHRLLSVGETGGKMASFGDRTCTNDALSMATQGEIEMDQPLGVALDSNR